MKNENNYSEDFLLDILKQEKFNLTLTELDSALSPNLKEKIFGRNCLVSEKFKSDQGVKNWNLLSLKYFKGNVNVRKFGSHLS